MTFIDDNGLIQFSHSRKTWTIKTVCEICGIFGGKIYADHCHLHGWVRGWLCNICNDSIALLEKHIYCAACSFNPSEWHQCSAAYQRYLMQNKSAIYIHVIKCPDCKPIIQATMQRNLDVALYPYSRTIYARDSARNKQKTYSAYKITPQVYYKWSTAGSGNPKSYIKSSNPKWFDKDILGQIELGRRVLYCLYRENNRTTNNRIKAIKRYARRMHI